MRYLFYIYILYDKRESYTYWICVIYGGRNISINIRRISTGQTGRDNGNEKGMSPTYEKKVIIARKVYGEF